ncbi:MAG TPA: hypothetical protein H9845_05830 [Candidatus Agathobaculum pullicola]|uniref:hypothetical protein n=1 Tax=Candidatus Agathobaculum pullicola TaxID=2838426 RepID=UPI001F848CBB|nr:hypothetical protein [Candidatus Agathobaculum pullicola]
MKSLASDKCDVRQVTEKCKWIFDKSNQKYENRVIMNARLYGFAAGLLKIRGGIFDEL